jgi:CDP-diacylglycerol--serine O-phosphatidyltransferase
MSKRTSGAVTNGAASKDSSTELNEPCMFASCALDLGNIGTNLFIPYRTAQDKQKVLLSADVGHFSLIRALHLADLITELNGMRTLFKPQFGV